MEYRNNRLIIDLKQIADNYLALQKSLPSDTALLAVVKADAYGHGLVKVSQKLEAVGCPGFCVAIVEEGIALREANIKGDIFILGLINDPSIAAAIQYDLILCVSSLEQLKRIQKQAALLNKCAKIHIAVNTGMNRIGIHTREELLSIVDFVGVHHNVDIVSTFTHLAFADENPQKADYISTFTQEQIKRYQAILDGLSLPDSAANSAGIVRIKPYHFTYARAGIILYGYSPVCTEIPVKPCMSWQSEVVHVTDVRRGESIGYGRSFVANKDMRIAVAAVGYGDGYFRSLSNQARAIIRGEYANVVGRVCMDQIMVDVSHIDQVCSGDVVTLLGKSGDKVISAEELAALAGTISYEILLNPSQRVYREYKDEPQ